MPTYTAEIRPGSDGNSFTLVSAHSSGEKALQPKTPDDKQTIGAVIYQQVCNTCSLAIGTLPCPAVEVYTGSSFMDSMEQPLNAHTVPRGCLLQSSSPPEVQIPMLMLENPLR